MKKLKSILVLAAFTLMACTDTPATISSSNETPVVSSIETPVASSSELPSSISSETPVSSSSIAPSFDADSLVSASIVASDVPLIGQSKYVTNSEITCGSATFAVNDIQRNDGKYKPTSTIQMKKCEDNDPTSIIENVTPIHGKLTIKMLGNVVSYTDYDEETWEPIEVYKDMTICPVVYAGMSKDGITNKLTFVESNPNHVDKEEYSFTFEDAANYQYFKIVNESANAVYLSSITWGE